MKKSVFVTGMPASGKSLVCKELNRLGYEAYDIEDLRGLFKMVRKDTGKDFKNYDNADIKKVKNANWVCDTNKLKQLLQKQKEETAFYCGVATNNDEMALLFNRKILLKVSSEVLRQRLGKREGTGDFGTTAESREWALSWKDWFENRAIEQGAVAVDADGSPTDVAQKVAELVLK